MGAPSKFDQTDKNILELLFKDGGMSKAEIGREIGLAPSAVFERLKKLRAEGILKGTEIRVDPEKLGYELLSFTFVAEVKPNEGFDLGRALSEIRGVEEVHKIASEDCFLVKLRARGTKHLAEILNREINTIPKVSQVRSVIVLQTIKETAPLVGCGL